MVSAEAVARYPYPVEQPATLRAQQHTIGNLGQLLLDSWADVNDHTFTLADSWRSDTATQAVADVGALGAAMHGDSTVLDTAASAVGTYVGHVDEARTDIDGIRRRYDDAVTARDHDNSRIPPNLDPEDARLGRQANQAELDGVATGLDAEHATVLSTLASQAASAVSELNAALHRFVGPNPPETGSLGAVAFQTASLSLTLTSDSTYEFALRQAGLLSGASPKGAYATWLANAEQRGVDPSVIVSIARDHDLSPDDFALLDGMIPVTDPDGKTYFSLPAGTSGDEARRAALLAYVLNCGTDYGAAGEEPGVTLDFEETPYSSAEVQRIIDRQNANSWSYGQDVAFVQGNGGRLMATPNGMLMGVGGNLIQDVYSQKGGTTWGDIFMVNIDGPSGDDAAATLQQIAESGTAWYEDDGLVYQGSLDLDRLLHHEERHSQQWASEGYAGFLLSYGWELAIGGNETEEGAGLHDGGYR